MIREYVVLRNRTDGPVTFTYGGEQKTIAPLDKLIVDTEVARFLFSCDQVLGVRRLEDGGRAATYRLGIEEGPDTLKDFLGAEAFETDPFDTVPFTEHPDLAAVRDVQVKRVASHPGDFRVETVAVR